jgi:chromosome segregation ATPase
MEAMTSPTTGTASNTSDVSDTSDASTQGLCGSTNSLVENPESKPDELAELQIRSLQHQLRELKRRSVTLSRKLQHYTRGSREVKALRVLASRLHSAKERLAAENRHLEEQLKAQDTSTQKMQGEHNAFVAGIEARAELWNKLVEQLEERLKVKDSSMQKMQNEHDAFIAGLTARTERRNKVFRGLREVIERVVDEEDVKRIEEKLSTRIVYWLRKELEGLKNEKEGMRVEEGRWKLVKGGRAKMWCSSVVWS